MTIAQRVYKRLARHILSQFQYFQPVTLIMKFLLSLVLLAIVTGTHANDNKVEVGNGVGLEVGSALGEKLGSNVGESLGSAVGGSIVPGLGTTIGGNIGTQFGRVA